MDAKKPFVHARCDVSQETTVGDMDNKPSVSAPAMTDRQVGAWLKEMSEVAESIWGFGPLHHTAKRLPSVAGELRDLLNDISQKINYLEAVQIVRPADLSTLILEDLSLLRETSQSILCSLQAIETCFVPLQQNQEKHWRLFESGEDRESSEPTKGESDSGL